MKKGIIVIILFLSACGPSVAEREPLVLAQASKDFSCPKNSINLAIVKQDSGAMIWGRKLVIFNAQGCGKKQSYDSIDLQVYKSFGN